MQVNYKGNRDAKVVLLQIIGEHELMTYNKLRKFNSKR